MRSQALAKRIVGALVAAGVDTMFGVPGGGPNLDLVGEATARGMRFVLAHGETAAAIMAAAYGLLRRAPAPVVVTRGPGAASVTNGLAQATLDRYPLVVLADTVPSSSVHRVAHQRLDQRHLLGSVAKASATVGDDTTDVELAALIEAAVRWPSGGVHLDVDASVAGPPADDAGAVAPGTHLVAGVPLTADAVDRDGPREEIDRAVEVLLGSHRPAVILGMEAATVAFAANTGKAGYGVFDQPLDALGCPVLTTYQAVGTVPSEGPRSAGLFTNGALERPVLERADAVLTLGLDLVEPIPAPWDHEGPVVRLSATTSTDHYLPVTVDVVGDIAESLRRIVDAATEQAGGPLADRWAWSPDEPARLRTEARNRITTAGALGGDGADDPAAAPAAAGPGHDAGAPRPLGPIEVVAAVDAARPDPSTTTVDAGAHFLAVMPAWRVERPFELLISNGLATMGFALPAAIGAALARPGEPVVALTGDGGLSMTLGELETVARLDLPITVVVFNDAALSLIEIKQGPDHGGTDAVRYRPVDYAAVATASGLAASVVSTVDELRATLSDHDWSRPALVDARIDPSPYRRILAATRG